MTIAVAIILGIIVIAIVGYPLYRPAREIPRSDEGHSALSLHEDVIISKMQELQSEFERGTTPEDVYTELKEEFEQELATLIESPQSIPKHVAVTNEEQDDELERQIREVRQTRSKAPLKSTGETCPKCGAKHKPNDKFCPSCGTRLVSK